VVVALALNAGARWAVALGVAFAPNVWRLGPPSPAFELPADLAARGRRLETQVGPPQATLVSWLLEPSAQPARGSIVLLHGVRQDRRSLLGAGQAFADAGYRSILVDLRGHGESSGTFLTYGAVETHDLSQLLDGLSSAGVELGPVGVYGFSYGAAVAIDLGARDRRVAAVVAVAPFASLRAVLADYRTQYLPAPLNRIPDSWFDLALGDASWLASFDPEQSSPLRSIASSTTHQLLIHGTADTQVPLRHSQALFDVAGPLAELLAIPGATHHSLPNQVIQQRALDWFARWLGPERSQL